MRHPVGGDIELRGDTGAWIPDPAFAPRPAVQPGVDAHAGVGWPGGAGARV